MEDLSNIIQLACLPTKSMLACLFKTPFVIALLPSFLHLSFSHFLYLINHLHHRFSLLHFFFNTLLCLFMASKVPKFGAWGEAGGGGGENFTVYFDTARKTKNNGLKINPNDPEENPDFFGDKAPSQTRADEQRRTKQGGPSLPQPQNEPSLPRADEQKRTRQGGSDNNVQARPRPTPQVGRAKVPEFGAWNGGEGTQYTAYFDSARKTKNVGGEPVINRDVGDKGRERDPPAAKARAEPKGSASSEGLAKQTSGPKEPVNPRVNPQSRSSGGRGNQAASIPRYGAWNTDPSQAEGYTVAFERAKEERRTPLHNNVAPTYQQPATTYDTKQSSCCTIL